MGECLPVRPPGLLLIDSMIGSGVPVMASHRSAAWSRRPAATSWSSCSPDSAPGLSSPVTAARRRRASHLHAARGRLERQRAPGGWRSTEGRPRRRRPPPGPVLHPRSRAVVRCRCRRVHGGRTHRRCTSEPGALPAACSSIGRRTRRGRSRAAGRFGRSSAILGPSADSISFMALSFGCRRSIGRPEG